MEIEYGYCHCGCGGRTSIPKTNNKSVGRIKGIPMRFIQGHHSRMPGAYEGRNFLKGANHPNWKGGKKNNIGYTMVHYPIHHRADSQGYVREHILICEEVLNKPFPIGAIPHHVDHDKSNNRNDNLVICQDRAYHNLLHRRENALRACGHANWRKCRVCKQYDDPINLSSDGRHKSCHAKYERERRAEKRGAPGPGQAASAP